jgi:hypothetical protein
MREGLICFAFGFGSISKTAAFISLCSSRCANFSSTHRVRAWRELRITARFLRRAWFDGQMAVWNREMKMLFHRRR